MKGIMIFSLLFLGIMFLSAEEDQSVQTDSIPADTLQSVEITFLELGSVNCIPCKMMQPVMANIEVKYKDTVAVIFHDVKTDEGKKYGQLYGIRVIPTQVFLDSDGEEFFRHEGFFPEEEIIKLIDEQLIK